MFATPVLLISITLCHGSVPQRRPEDHQVTILPHSTAARSFDINMFSRMQHSSVWDKKVMRDTSRPDMHARRPECMDVYQGQTSVWSSVSVIFTNVQSDVLKTLRFQKKFGFLSTSQTLSKSSPSYLSFSVVVGWIAQHRLPLRLQQSFLWCSLRHPSIALV